MRATLVSNVCYNVPGKILEVDFTEYSSAAFLSLCFILLFLDYCFLFSKLGSRFQVKKKQFFKNFTTILLFGILGTVISFCLISLG